MQIGVIEGRCVGHALCQVAASDLFGTDDEGFVSLLPEGGLVPVGREAAAREGIDSCPEGALILRDPSIESH